jgi:hypothetical protein
MQIEVECVDTSGDPLQKGGKGDESVCIDPLKKRGKADQSVSIDPLKKGGNERSICSF